MFVLKPEQICDAVDVVEVCDDLGECTILDATRAVGPDGMMRVKARVARTGVQVYRMADGSTVRRYRPPEEVFAPDSMASWDRLVITADHPPKFIDANNAKQYQRGATGTQATRDGKFLVLDLLISDGDLVGDVLANRRRQISGGYKALIDRTPGTSPDGEVYDEVMREIRGNHVAMVGAARGGPELQPALDSADPSRVAVRDRTADPEVPVAKMKLNGVEREVPDNLVDAILAEVKAHQDAAAAATAKATGLEGELAGEKAKVATLAKDLKDAKDAAPDEAKILAKHAARQELLATAKKHGVVVVENDSDDALRRKVVAKLAPTIALDGQDEAFVAGVFKALAAQAPAQAPRVTDAGDDARRAAVTSGTSPARDASTLDSIDADRRYEAQTSHLRPIGVTRDSLK